MPRERVRDGENPVVHVAPNANNAITKPLPSDSVLQIDQDESEFEPIILGELADNASREEQIAYFKGLAEQFREMIKRERRSARDMESRVKTRIQEYYTNMFEEMENTHASDMSRMRELNEELIDTKANIMSEAFDKMNERWKKAYENKAAACKGSEELDVKEDIQESPKVSPKLNSPKIDTEVKCGTPDDNLSTNGNTKPSECSPTAAVLVPEIRLLEATRTSFQEIDSNPKNENESDAPDQCNGSTGEGGERRTLLVSQIQYLKKQLDDKSSFEKELNTMLEEAGSTFINQTTSIESLTKQKNALIDEKSCWLEYKEHIESRLNLLQAESGRAMEHSEDVKKELVIKDELIKNLQLKLSQWETASEVTKDDDNDGLKSIELESKIYDLEKGVETLKQEKTSLEAQIQLSEGKRHDIQDAANKRINTLTDSHSEEIGKVRSELEETQKKLVTQTEACEAALIGIETTQKKLTPLETKCKDKDMQIETLEGQIKDLENVSQQLQEIEKSKKSMEMKCNMQEQLLQTQKSQIGEMQGKIQANVEESDALKRVQSELSELRESVDKQKAKFEEKRMELEGLAKLERAKTAEATEMLVVGRKEVEKVNTQVSLLKDEINARNKKFDELLMFLKLKPTDNFNDSVDAIFECFKLKDATIQENTKKIEDLSRKNEELQKTMNKSLKESEDCLKGSNQVKLELCQFREEVVNLKMKNLTSEESLKEAKNHNLANDEIIQKNAATIKNLEQENEKLKKDLEAQVKQVKHLESGLVETEDVQQKFEKLVNEKNTEIEQAKKQCSEFSARVVEIQKEMQDSEKLCKSFEQQKILAENGLNRLTQESTQLHAALQASQTALADEKMKAASVVNVVDQRDTVNQLVNEVSTLKNELLQKNTELEKLRVVKVQVVDMSKAIKQCETSARQAEERRKRELGERDEQLSKWKKERDELVTKLKDQFGRKEAENLELMKELQRRNGILEDGDEMKDSPVDNGKTSAMPRKKGRIEEDESQEQVELTMRLSTSKKATNRKRTSGRNSEESAKSASTSRNKRTTRAQIEKITEEVANSPLCGPSPEKKKRLGGRQASDASLISAVSTAMEATESLTSLNTAADRDTSPSSSRSSRRGSKKPSNSQTSIKKQNEGIFTMQSSPVALSASVLFPEEVRTQRKAKTMARDSMFAMNTYLKNSPIASAVSSLSRKISSPVVSEEPVEKGGKKRPNKGRGAAKGKLEWTPEQNTSANSNPDPVKVVTKKLRSKK